MITGEEFVVKVTAETASAEKKVSKFKQLWQDFKSGLKEGLSTDVGDTTSGLKEQSKQVHKTSQAWKELTKAFTLVEIVKKGVQRLNASIQEGIKSVYEYSKGLGGAFSQTMDKLSGKSFAFKNALGAAASSLIQGIEPILSRLLEWLTEIINRASKLIAQLFGLPTYLEANTDVMKEWSENNKQTKELISGFDTLTSFKGTETQQDIFTEKSTPVSSSGIGAIVEWFNSKFKPWWDDLTNKLKPITQEIGNSFKGIFDGLSDALFGQNDDTKLGETTGNVIVTLAEVIAVALKAIERIVNSESFKRFITVVKDLVTVVVGSADVLLTFVKGLIEVALGEKTWEDFGDELSDKVAEALVKPLKDLGLDLKIWWYKLMDEVEVAVYNLQHPFSKIEHGTMYSHYQTAFRERYGSYADGYTQPQYGEKKEADPQELVKMLRESGYNTEDIRKIIMNTEGITADELKRKYGLAKGAVITKPTLRLMGEYANASSNPELVTPQKLLDERLTANNESLISAYGQMTKQLVSAIEGVNMSVKVGDDVIAQSTARGGSSYYKLTGEAIR